MRFPRTIMGSSSSTYLDGIRFEELPGRYGQAPRDIYHEFNRRLQPFVLQAARRRSQRIGAELSQDADDALAIKAFAEFLPNFAVGEPALVLCRFAFVLRHVLDDESFDSIARRYYMQIPIYHMPDDGERAFLAAAYQEFLDPDPGAGLSKRFNISASRAEEMLKTANASLGKVIKSHFKPGELQRLTEGLIKS